MVNRVIARILERLYEYDSARAAKDHLRPLKHLIFGKDDVYLVTDLINRARRGDHPVRSVFDVGAAYGDKTLTFLRAFPQSAVHCFEPQTTSRRRLIRRTAKWRDRVVVHDYGLYAENCVVDLRLYSYPDASSILPVPKYMRDEGKTEVGIETVTVRRLDDCLAELSATAIDVLKIDVEGVEKEVLQGAVCALAITDNVLVEISPMRKGPYSRDHIEVLTLLHDAGFTLMGQYVDYWFSKDPQVMRMFFGAVPRA
jgi:FkbM family methyltransferase